MAGLRGKHTKFWLDGYALTALTSEIAAGMSRDELEESGYGMDHSTLSGMVGSTLTVNGYFSTYGSGGFHDALRTMDDEAVLASTVFGENAAPAQGDITLSQQTEHMEYNIVPLRTGVMGIMAKFTQKTTAPDFGLLLVDDTVTETGATTSTDNGGSSSNGGVGILHLTGVSAGDTIEVLIEDSDNDSDWGTLITFTLDGSEVGAERLEVSGDVEQYVRASYTITGSDPSFDIAVMFSRK